MARNLSKKKLLRHADLLEVKVFGVEAELGVLLLVEAGRGVGVRDGWDSDDWANDVVGVCAGGFDVDGRLVDEWNRTVPGRLDGAGVWEADGCCNSSIARRVELLSTISGVGGGGAGGAGG
eukprot:scaffold4612_cov63-Cyclotella_meneghiniana.AAC.6